MGISTTVLQAGQGTRTSKRALPTQHPAFLRIIQALPHFFLTRRYFPCPQLLCPDLLGCPHSRTRLACLTGIWLETCEPEGAVSAETTGRNSPNRMLNPATNQILLEFGFGEKDVDVDSTFGTIEPPTRRQDCLPPSLWWATVSPMEIPEGRHLVVHEINERVVRAMLRQFPMSSDPAMAATMKLLPACIATR